MGGIAEFTWLSGRMHVVKKGERLTPQEPVSTRLPAGLPLSEAAWPRRGTSDLMLESDPNLGDNAPSVLHVS